MKIKKLYNTEINQFFKEWLQPPHQYLDSKLPIFPLSTSNPVLAIRNTYLKNSHNQQLN
jgi:hypothetical protein